MRPAKQLNSSFVRHLFVVLLWFETVCCVTGKLQAQYQKTIRNNIWYEVTNEIFRMTSRFQESIALFNLPQEMISYEKNRANPRKFWTFFNINLENKSMPVDFIDSSMVTISLFHAHNPEELKSMLEKLKHSIINHPRSKTIFLDKSEYLNNTLLTKYFKIFWTYQYSRAIIIRCRSNSNTPMVDIYRWNPLHNLSKCGINPTTFFKIGSYYLMTKKLVFKGNVKSSLFASAPPKKIGCPVRISAVVYPPFVIRTQPRQPDTTIQTFTEGFEVKIVKTVAENFGSKIIFMESEEILNWGTIQPNGSATGVYRELIENRADIGISAFTYIPRNKYVEFGPSYTNEHLIWCVPTPEVIMPFTRLASPFCNTVWIFYFLAYVLSSVLFWVFAKKSRREPRFNKNVANIFMKLAADITGNTVNNQTPKSSSARIFRMFWLVFTFHMTVMYSGKLFSMLTLITRDVKYNNLDDVFKSNLRLQLLPWTKLYMKTEYSNHNYYTSLIMNKSKTCGVLSECLERVIVTRDSAICLSSSMIRYLDQFHLPLQCLHKDKFISIPITMIIRKHYYLGREVQQQVSRLFDSGLIEYWKQKALKMQVIYKTWLWDSLNFTAYLDYDQTNKISFDILKPAFGLLLLGHGLAFVVFLVELYCYYRKLNGMYRKVLQKNENLVNLHHNLYKT